MFAHVGLVLLAYTSIPIHAESGDESDGTELDFVKKWAAIGDSYVPFEFMLLVEG